MTRTAGRLNTAVTELPPASWNDRAGRRAQRSRKLKAEVVRGS